MNQPVLDTETQTQRDSVAAKVAAQLDVPTALTYEIEYNQGRGWLPLPAVLSHTDPVLTLEGVEHLVERFQAIARVDPYYAGADIRVVQVTRRIARTIAST